MIFGQKEICITTMWLVRDVEQVFGTLTDKLRISNDLPKNCPEIFQEDLQVFRFMVKNGVLKEARFRPPEGYRILDFLTYLSQLQALQSPKTDATQRKELNEIYLKHYGK